MIMYDASKISSECKIFGVQLPGTGPAGQFHIQSLSVANHEKRFEIIEFFIIV